MTAARSTIAMIHVAAKELGLDAETRRDLQLRVTGKASLKDMTPGELDRVVEEFKKAGFKPVSKGGSHQVRRAAATRGDVRFCHVLWGKLWRAGVVEVRGAAGLNAFVRARYGAAWGAVPIDIDTMTDARQIATIIEGLKAMCLRAGVEM
jgi:hypothetical protein